MYHLNYLADGRVELCKLTPVTVAVFFDTALAETVADGLNDIASLPEVSDDDVPAPNFHGVIIETEEQPAATDDFDTEFEPLAPAAADQLLDAVVASQKEEERAADPVEEPAPAADPVEAEVAAPRGEPTDDDWSYAFAAVEGGADMAEVAATLGVTMPKLRGRYVAWKAAKKKTASAPVAAALPPRSMPRIMPRIESTVQDEPKPGWWRETAEFLGKLGYRGGWSAQLDLALVEGLASGKQMAIVADEIGKEFGEAKARFIALTPDGVTVERQQQLLQVLRARATVI